MQLQKNINKYELYSRRASKGRVGSSAVLSVKNKKGIFVILTLLVIALFAASIVAVNLAFDNTVLAVSPDYIMTTPEYSSFNSVFTGFKPNVTLSVKDRGNDELIISTEAVTLRKVLEECDVLIDDTCVVNHPLNTVVYDGMEIVINSVVYMDVDVESAIPHDVKNIEIQTIPKGTRNILTKGQNGIQTTTYRRKYVNGEFDSEMLISRKVTTTPVTEVAELGVGGTFVGKDGITYSYSYYIDVQATCYGKADGSGDITYTGTKAREGIIAVDPRVIPLNSKVYVTGSYRDLGVLSAEDTGGAIKGNIIDVYLEGTLQDLLEFGRRNMRAYVLE